MAEDRKHVVIETFINKGQFVAHGPYETREAAEAAIPRLNYGRATTGFEVAPLREAVSDD